MRKTLCLYDNGVLTIKTHEIVGTDFDFSNKKVGNEEFENWLHRLLNPKIDFTFYSLIYRKSYCCYFGNSKS